MRYYIQLDDSDMRVYDDSTLYEGDLDMGTIGARLAGRDLASLAPGAALEIGFDLTPFSDYSLSPFPETAAVPPHPG